MAENKTRPTSESVETFLKGIGDQDRREDCKNLAAMMEEITGERPKMWGDSIVGFGDYHYKYASGREGDWFLAGFSPRKQNLTIYITCDLEYYADMLDGLGVMANPEGKVVGRAGSHPIEEELPDIGSKSTMGGGVAGRWDGPAFGFALRDNKLELASALLPKAEHGDRTFLVAELDAGA